MSRPDFRIFQTLQIITVPLVPIVLFVMGTWSGYHDHPTLNAMKYRRMRIENLIMIKTNQRKFLPLIKR